MRPIATGLTHAALAFLFGLLRGTFFLHGLGRLLLALLFTVHAFAHGDRSFEDVRQADPDGIKR